MHAYTKRKYTNLYINAAIELGVGYKVIDEDFGMVEFSYQDKKINFMECYFDVNSMAGLWITKNKYLTAQKLSKITELYPRQKLFCIKNFEKNKSEIIKSVNEYVRKKEYKVVIKALDLLKGKGVFVLPKNDDEVLSAIEQNYHTFGQKYVIIEDYFKSRSEYRVLVCWGKVVDVLKRIPAYVEGNGTNTIKQLVDNKNRIRRESGFKEIIVDSRIDLKEVLSQGEVISVNNLCNLAQGGEVERVNIDSLHPDFQDIFMKIYEQTDLGFMGIDLMIANDISDKPTAANAFINEINLNPSPQISNFADIKTSQPYKGLIEILKNLFRI